MKQTLPFVAAILLGFGIGCQPQQSSVNQSAPETELAKAPKWGVNIGGIRIRNLTDPAKTLREWWIEKSVETIELEGPPLEFAIKDNGGPISDWTDFELSEGTQNYKITIVHELIDAQNGKTAKIVVRIKSSHDSPIVDAKISRIGTLSANLQLESAQMTFGTAPFVESKFANEHFIIWSAYDDTNRIDVVARPKK
jgi:hypothetical protein